MRSNYWRVARLSGAVVTAMILPQPSAAQVRPEGALAPIVREHGAPLPVLARSASASAMKTHADNSAGRVAVSTRALPLASDAGLDSGKTSRRGHHAKTGALIGGGVGLGLGVIAIGVDAGSGESESPNEGLNVALGAVAVTAILAIIGGGIGWLFP